MTFDQQRADYLAALNWVAGLMAATRLRQLNWPTPCGEFDVRTLLGHLIGTAERGLRTAERRSARHVPHVVEDVPGALMATTYAALVTRIAAAWEQLPGNGAVSAPWGDCTPLEAARGFTVETVVHGWDLAVATGRPSEAPAGIAQRCLPFAGSLIPARLRGVMYGMPVPAQPEEPATGRLARLLGRERPLAHQAPTDPGAPAARGISAGLRSAGSARVET